MMNMSEETDFDEKIKELLAWFKENPKLPEEIDLILLKRFLKCMKEDVEETKKLIEHHYTIRIKNPHMYTNRDPKDESSMKTRIAGDFAPLPGLTPEGHKILFFRMNDLDPKIINSLEECKVFYMLSDCRFTMPDEEGETEEDHKLAEGDIQIVDLKGYTLAHATRVSFSISRVHMKFMQEAYPVRLKAMHILNCPSFFDRMLALFKPFMKPEVYNMIHFHTTGLETLYEHVPRDMLPEEYGGKAGKMADIKDQWTQIMHDKRDYLTDPKYWTVEQVNNRSRWSWF